MGQRMTWEEIKRHYPNEWVAVVNYTTDQAGDVDGEVAVHSRDKSEFYSYAEAVVSQYGGMAMRYTGTLITNENLPLLWRTIHTT